VFALKTLEWHWNPFLYWSSFCVWWTCRRQICIIRRVAIFLVRAAQLNNLLADAESARQRAACTHWERIVFLTREQQTHTKFALGNAGQQHMNVSRCCGAHTRPYNYSARPIIFITTTQVLILGPGAQLTSNNNKIWSVCVCALFDAAL